MMANDERRLYVDSADLRRVLFKASGYHEGESKLKGKGALPPLSALKTPLQDGDLDRPEDPAYTAAGS